MKPVSRKDLVRVHGWREEHQHDMAYALAYSLGPEDSFTTSTVWLQRSTYLWLCYPHPSSLRPLDKMNFLPPVDSHSRAIGYAINVAAVAIGLVCLLLGVLA